MPIPARLAIVGDYDSTMYTHLAIDDALRHVRELREHALEWSWIGTSTLTSNAVAQLALVDAVWLAPGSPYASLDGALAAVRFARERGIPFLVCVAAFNMRSSSSRAMSPVFTTPTTPNRVLTRPRP